MKPVRLGQLLMAIASLGALVGCGDPQSTSNPFEQAPRPVAASTATTYEPSTSSTPSTTMSPTTTLPTNSSVAQAPTTLPAAESMPEPVQNLTITVGSVTLELPKGASEYRQFAAVPDFVLATHRWSVPQTGALIVTTENLIPPFPDENLVTEFVTNGLHWRLYRDQRDVGSVWTAVAATSDTTSVILTGQAWGGNRDTIVQGYVDEMARSLTAEGVNP